MPKSKDEHTVIAAAEIRLDLCITIAVLFELNGLSKFSGIITLFHLAGTQIANGPCSVTEALAHCEKFLANYRPVAEIDNSRGQGKPN